MSVFSKLSTVPFLIASGGLLWSCSAVKKGDGAGLLPAFPAAPQSTSTVEDLKAIADSAYAQLPPHLASGGAPPEPPDGGPSDIEIFEVNPGDIFSEKDGPLLVKQFSLLDGLPDEERRTLIGKIATTRLEHISVTLSRSEIAELRSASDRETELPTRSVALDLRNETHTLDEVGHLKTLDALDEAEGGPEQLRSLKARLRSGERLYIVTSVTEAERIRASYPGAPIGRRDTEPVRNAVQGAFPHLPPLAAEKVDDAIEITGEPRILWQFETREIKLENDRLRIEPASTATL